MQATKRIEKLTPEQAADLPAWRERWLQYGLSTELADRPRAEAAFRVMYRELGEDEPFVLWLDSPASAVLAHAVFSAAKPLNIKRDQLWDQLRDQLWDQLWGQLRDQLRDQLRGQLGDQLRNSLSQFAGWGSWEWWVPFYVYPRDVLGLVYSDAPSRRLDAWVDVMQSCGWWMPFKGLVIACERPSTIQRDERGRLHCEDGPALEFRDGYAAWAWHGVRVDQYIIERPETMTAEAVLGQPNQEVRRVMVTRFGAERLMHEGGGEAVHSDDWGKLWRLPLDGDEPLMLVEVVNSTPEPDGTWKTYYLRVPPTVRSAHEAIKWTHGLPLEAEPLVMT